MSRTFQTFFQRQFLPAVLLLCSLSVICHAQAERSLPSVTYRLAMSRPVSHLFEVTIEVELPKDSVPEFLDFQMPTWSPGRYSVFDFAKNVQQFGMREIRPPNARCDAGSSQLKRVDTQTWRVFLCKSVDVTVSYKVFGNDLSGTFSQLDSRHANFNGGSIFMYVVNHKPDPVKLVIEPPVGWRIVAGRTDRAISANGSFPTTTHDRHADGNLA